LFGFSGVFLLRVFDWLLSVFFPAFS
jgi:hypothetical protein